MRRMIVLTAIAVCFIQMMYGQNEKNDLFAWWKFNTSGDIPTRFEDEGPEIPREITIEGWVSLGAYPWNWAPILTIGKYKITGFYFGIDSRGCLGFHVSDATSVWHECNSSINPKTKLGMDLNKWYHVAGTYSPSGGLAVYVNGELAGTYNDFQFDYGIAYSDMEQGFRMGMNRVELAPTDPIRDWATWPSRYTLDGIVDELKIHKTALKADEVKKIYNSITPENEPEFAPRRFPTVASSGRFGANYTSLKYYPEWDAIWPVGDHLDVVVQIISDGRSAYAPDRAAHSSLSWGDPNGEAALYGMTNQGNEYIVDLARSWNNPPDLVLEMGKFNSLGYDYTQRAYLIDAGNVKYPRVHK